MYLQVCLLLLSRQLLSSLHRADGSARAVLQIQVHSAHPAVQRSLKNGYAHAVSQTAVNSVLTAERAKAATLLQLPSLPNGPANAALQTQASSVPTAESRSLQLPRSTSATSAVGYPQTPKSLRSSALNAATFSTKTTYSNLLHNKIPRDFPGYFYAEKTFPFFGNVFSDIRV